LIKREVQIPIEAGHEIKKIKPCHFRVWRGLASQIQAQGMMLISHQKK
jgi:hypothetical protein